MGPDGRERFEQLYRAEAGVVLRYATHRLGRSAAEDVVADTFAVAWRRLGDVPTPARPWLLAVARKTIANTVRSASRRTSTTLRDDFALPGDLAEEVAVRRSLVEALGGLTPRDREVIALVAWYGLTNREAAGVLGCSATAFAVRLHRARSRLRTALAATTTQHDPTATEVRP